MGTNGKGLIPLNGHFPAYPVHPGSILGEELKARGIRQKDFAAQIGIQASHLSALIHGVRNFTVETASKIASALEGIPASFWMEMQAQYFLDRNHHQRKYSSYVDGYHKEKLTPALLNDCSCEKTRLLTLSIPETDTTMLQLLADRLGWEVTEQGR